MPYMPVNPVRMVTATSLFDGHDASINIMRRILQSKGVEIIHLGHNRSVQEIVECAIQEDVQGIAITSYQGGHLEFFTYMKDLLDASGCRHIKIVGIVQTVVFCVQFVKLTFEMVQRVVVHKCICLAVVSGLTAVTGQCL
jgi:methylmalonyl-CoA mutase cobalamin-binding domain/chain